MFHRKFPDRRIKRGVMTKVMKIAGMSKRKVEICNIPAKKEQRVEEFADKTIALDNRLNTILLSGGHLVFLDECVFKSRDFTKKAWSQPY